MTPTEHLALRVYEQEWHVARDDPSVVVAHAATQATARRTGLDPDRISGIVRRHRSALRLVPRRSLA